MVERVLAAGPPLAFGAWTLRPQELATVLARIEASHEAIAECGSGLSTVAIARLLAARGHGRVWSLEHDPAWAAQTRRWIEAEKLAEHARVITAPLAAHPLAQPGCLWYSATALDGLPQGIDLLLVDGPPANEPAIARARYPALPVLGGRLRAGATVILDDADRPGEAWALDRWRREASIRFERRARDRLAIGVCCRETTRIDRARMQGRGNG